MTEMFVARTSAVVFTAGRRYTVVKDATRVSEDSPLYQHHRSLFKPLEAHFPGVEQTTARPGEKRRAPKSPKRVKDSGDDADTSGDA